MLPEYCTTLVKNCKYVQFTNIYKIFFVGFKELPVRNIFCKDLNMYVYFMEEKIYWQLFVMKFKMDSANYFSFHHIHKKANKSFNFSKIIAKMCPLLCILLVYIVF